MGTRPVRMPNVLRDAATHVNYEIQMLIFAAEHLDGSHSSPMATPAGCEKNMALESFLLHFRNLRAFLCPSIQRNKCDDVLASDFLGRTQPEDLGDAAALEKDKERLDQMLAHLSYSRDKYIAAGKDQWPCGEMATTLIGQLLAFVSTLPQERQSWFTIPPYRLHSSVLTGTTVVTTSSSFYPPMGGPMVPGTTVPDTSSPAVNKGEKE